MDGTTVASGTAQVSRPTIWWQGAPWGFPARIPKHWQVEVRTVRITDLEMLDSFIWDEP